MNVKNNTEAYLMPTYGRFPIVFEKGEGCYLEDEEGKQYLDFCAGIATNTLGYHHPVLTQALQEQVAKVTHLSNYYYSKPLAEAATLLIEQTTFDRAFFCNSGTEANEGAIKIARKYGSQKDAKKIQIVSMRNAFHGRTYGALTATAQEKYQAPFGPMLEGFHYVDFNDAEAIHEVMNQDVCAVMLEVIQGEGGIIEIEPAYLEQVKSLCKQYDALLIVDEVQTGMGRTGKLFAHEHYDVQPDIITLAKGLGAGIPIGAILCNEKASVLTKGDHGTTFGGNPLATTAATVVLTELLAKGLLEHVQEVGDYLKEQLGKLSEKHACIQEIRGKGLIYGIQLEDMALPVIKSCLEKGLLVVGAGEKVMRLLPPLIVSKEEVDKAIKIVDEALLSNC